jgi:hypothetical protein
MKKIPIVIFDAKLPVVKALTNAQVATNLAGRCSLGSGSGGR